MSLVSNLIAPFLVTHYIPNPFQFYINDHPSSGKLRGLSYNDTTFPYIEYNMNRWGRLGLMGRGGRREEQTGTSYFLSLFPSGFVGS